MRPLSAAGASITYDDLVIVSGAVGVRRSWLLEDGLPGLDCSTIFFEPYGSRMSLCQEPSVAGCEP